MRNPKRVYKILELVAKAWIASPDLRLAQLIHTAVELSGYNGDPYYCEDDALVDGLNEMLKAQRILAATGGEEA